MDSAAGFTILPENIITAADPPASVGSLRPALWMGVLDVAEADIPPRPWVAPGYLMRGAVTALFGAGSAGKSSLMVAWSIALARGRPCHRMQPIGPCRVLLYNVEDNADEQRRRFAASLREADAATDDVRENIILAGPHGVGTLLQPHHSTGQPTAEAAMRELEAMIKVHRPDVLILDPFAELHTVDENDNTGIRAVMAEFRVLAQRHNMAVVLVHHTRKGSAAAAGDAESGRGASAISSAARIVLTAVPMTTEEEKGFGLPEGQRQYLFRLDGAKSNYARLTQAEWFERQARELDNGEPVAAVQPWTPPKDSVSTDARAAIVAEVERGSTHGPWSSKLSRDARSIKHLFARHGVTTLVGQKAILDELTTTAGFTISTFINAARVKASGLRSSSGEPQAQWT